MAADAFELDHRLAETSALVATWPLSQLRLRDEARFPWLLLIPCRPGVSELGDLAPADYATLAAELLAATRLVQEVARPDKINVAMFGNIVPQLHVHVIARFRGDPAWPGAVFCAGEGPRYAPEERRALVARYAALARRLRPG
jgi:diadenosine tetraphosphate (Ap4A) HIT family hydrolase